MECDVSNNVRPQDRENAIQLNINGFGNCFITKYIYIANICTIGTFLLDRRAKRWSYALHTPNKGQTMGEELDYNL